MHKPLIIPYRFRSIIDADLPTVERWLKTPEVARWWGDPAEQLVLLKEDLDDPLMRQWIVEYGKRPLAYVQAYEAHAWPQVHLQGLPGGTQVIDAFIGEPDMLGHGHGSAFLRLLASRFIREGAPLVAIDPDAANLRARRAFARAGFAEDAVVEAKQGVVVLMVLGADARNARKSQAPQHPSPARPARPEFREQPRPKADKDQDFAALIDH